MINKKHFSALKKTLKFYSEYEENHPSATPNDGDYDDDVHYKYYCKWTQIINDNFYSEYSSYFNKKYFLGCSFDVYKKTYKDRLTIFKESFFNADEIDFIKDELDAGIFKYFLKNFKYPYTDPKTREDQDSTQEQISVSLKKRFEYLQQRAKENGFYLEYGEFNHTSKKELYDLEPIRESLDQKKDGLINDINNLKTLQWQGSELQLTELIKALRESNQLNPELSQKEIFERFRWFMQVGNYNEADKLKEIRKRIKDKTPFLNILEIALNNWIHKKD